MKCAKLRICPGGASRYDPRQNTYAFAACSRRSVRGFTFDKDVARIERSEIRGRLFSHFAALNAGYKTCLLQVLGYGFFTMSVSGIASNCS